MHATSGPRELALPFSLHRAYTVLLLVAGLLLVWIWTNSEGGPALHQILVAGDPTLEGFLTHQLFHESGLHVALDMLAILVAGGVLESYWGTQRFLAFSLVVVLGVATVSTLAGSLLVVGDANVTLATFGASGLALGYLTCIAVAYPRDDLLSGLSIRQAAWSVVLLGATGLVALDVEGAQREIQPYLIPQISGVGFAMAFLWALPRVESWRRERQRLREREEREKVIDIRLRVDELLDKINTQGYGSLTPTERSFLRYASRYYKQENRPERK
ncbi:MAG TPA: rhomboid family intramembrane serine protease [Planctomycetota bacterium]|nr:rhomboid family intramembrane serine protease [Planctomycetota bacterium]